MYKLLVYMDRVTVSKNVETRCYVFEFQTKDAAEAARLFFSAKSCSAIWVKDGES